MRVSVDGTSLWFDVDGPALVPDGPAMRERPTVVLLHGGPGSFDHTYFKPEFARLTEVAQVVYLDLYGHGRSLQGELPPDVLGIYVYLPVAQEGAHAMQTKQASIFTSVRTEGALLPAGLLVPIAEGKDVSGLTPSDYHLSGEKLNEATNGAWNRPVGHGTR
jgi:pimeloyl-ACP methyl ester carboxylesterase